MVTVSIIDPPVRNGGIAASRSRRPYSTPMPVGPSILWPENAAKSTSERVEVDGLVRHRLAGVQNGQRPDRLRPRHQLGDRVRSLR